MIFLETTFKHMNKIIKESQEPIEYLILLFNIDTKEPYLSVIYKKDNVSKEELNSLLLHLYGVVIYDYNKIDKYVDFNQSNQYLSEYINEAVQNQIKDDRLKIALSSLFKDKYLKEKEENIQQAIQSIYKNEKKVKVYTKLIKKSLKELDYNFMINGVNYDAYDIPVQQQKKNIVSMLKPIISDIIFKSKGSVPDTEIEDLIYSFFFKSLDDQHSNNEYNYNGITRGKFDKHIVDKIAAKSIEILAIQNDGYFNKHLTLLETEVFILLNRIDELQVKSDTYDTPTIMPATKRVFNTIVNHIQYNNLYSYNHRVNNSIHRMGIDTIYRTFHARDLRVKLKIDTSFNYVQDFRALKKGWEERGVALYGHLNDTFSEKCIRRDILEHSRAISYRIAGKLDYTATEQEVEVYNDKYQKSYNPDIQRYANIIGTLSSFDITLSIGDESKLRTELQNLETKYKRVA